LQSNATKFPSGIPALADYMHSTALKLGLKCDLYQGKRSSLAVMRDALRAADLRPRRRTTPNPTTAASTPASRPIAEDSGSRTDEHEQPALAPAWSAAPGSSPAAGVVSPGCAASEPDAPLVEVASPVAPSEPPVASWGVASPEASTAAPPPPASGADASTQPPSGH